MKIHPAEQNSLEWLAARSGVVTASEMDNLISPELKIRTGKTPETYLAQKLAEKWIGGPLPNFNSIDMDFGKILEEYAIPFFEFRHELSVTRVGLCLMDDGKVGCSPDGLIGEDSGIEIKCPKAETHVKYLLSGELPPDYRLQVHAAMYVTGRTSWRFMSYHRKFPELLLVLKRDEKIIGEIERALEDFMPKLDAGWKRLCEINGGPPERRSDPVAQPEFTSDPDDVPH